MARYTVDGYFVKRDNKTFARATGSKHWSDEDVAAYVAAACNHYAAFLGSVRGMEEAGSDITGQMELFSKELT